MNGTYRTRKGMDFHPIEDNNLPSTMPTAVEPPNNSNNTPYCTGDSSSRAMKKRSREWRSSSTFDSDEEWKQWLFTRGKEYDRDVSTKNATCPPVIESSPQYIQAMQNEHQPKAYSNRSLKGRPPTPWENLPIGYNPHLNLHHESKNILTPPEKLSNSSRLTRLMKQKLRVSAVATAVHFLIFRVRCSNFSFSFFISYSLRSEKVKGQSLLTAVLKTPLHLKF